MKYLFFIIILFFLNNCSFDNKTGIWKNDNIVSVNDKNSEMLKGFKDFSISENTFKKEIILKDYKRVNVLRPIQNFEWNDVYYNNENERQKYL